jgi:hypothetical protein
MMTRVATPEVDDHTDERHQAMAFAVDLHRGDFDAGDAPDVCDTATMIFRWLVPLTYHFKFGPVAYQDSGQPNGTTFGGTMSQLHADAFVTGDIIARDSRGNEVPDDPTTDTDNIDWELAEDGGNVVTLTVDENSRGFRLDPVGLGSTVLTATIQTSRGAREVTQAIDVIPGDVASMEIRLNAEQKQDDGSDGSGDGGETPVEPGV